MAAGSVARTSHFVLHQWQMPANLPAGAGLDKTLKMGALTPKRWAKRAATRNMIRRQIHAVSREFENGLQPTAYVVRLRASFNAHQFVSASSDALKFAVRKELQQLLGSVITP